jgi:quercetin dioxygenase-like cupin family protein
MIQQGQILINAVSGDFVEFVETAAQTGGEYSLMQITLGPGRGVVQLPHVHPYQSETFEILEGELWLRAGRDRLVARAGDVVTVTPGEIHRFRNAGDGRVRFLSTVAPSLGFEQLIQTMFSLAVDGKLGRNGRPNPIRLATIINAHFSDTRAPYVPAPLQRLLIATMAGLGRLLGYQSTYEAKRPLADFTPSTLGDRSEQTVNGQLGLAAPAMGSRSKEQRVFRATHLSVAERDAPQADDAQGSAAATG